MSGEVVFVPAGWKVRCSVSRSDEPLCPEEATNEQKYLPFDSILSSQHTVRNVVETISINHNWVHPASIDLVWDCVELEVGAVDEEAKKWGFEMDVPESEKMLRGACGLSVSMFFVMVLRAFLMSARRFGEAEEEEEKDDATYDCCCCREMMERLLDMDLVLERLGDGKSGHIKIAKRILSKF